MNQLITSLLCVSAIAPLAAEPLTVTSPDGRLKLNFGEDSDHRLSYSFQANDRPFINSSPLGFAVKDQAAAPKVASTSRRSVDTVWKPVWGKRTVVPERFNELTLDLTSYRIVARAYDDGVAFRYDSPPANATAELTRFNFAGDYTAWFYNGEQHQPRSRGEAPAGRRTRTPDSARCVRAVPSSSQHN